MTLLSCHLASSSGGGLVDKRDHFPFPSKFPILYSPLSRSIQTGQWIMYHHFSAASLFLYTPFFLDIEIPLLSSQLLLSHFPLSLHGFPLFLLPVIFSEILNFAPFYTVECHKGVTNIYKSSFHSHPYILKILKRTL